MNNNQTTGLKRKKRKIFYGWWVVVAVFICLFLDYALRYSFGVFFKPLVEEFGWSRAQTSLIFSLHMGVYAPSAFFWGWVSDRLSARFILSLGCAITGIAAALMYFCDSLGEAFLFFSILTPLGTGAIYVPGASTIGKFFRRKRGLALGVISTAVGLSYIWSPVAERLIYFYGWRAAYLISGILVSSIGIAFSWGLVRSSPEELGLFPDGENTGTGERSSVVSESLLSVENGLSKLLKVSSVLPIWFLNFMFMFAVLGFYIVNTHMVPYAIDMGIDPARAASALAFLGIFSVAGRIGLGAISDKIGRATIFYLSFIFQGVGIAILLFIKAGFILPFYLGAFILGIGYGGWVTQFPAVIGDIYGPARMGKLIGMNTFFGNLFGATLGPWLGGYIYDFTGTYTLAFLTGITASFAAVFLSIFLFRYIKKKCKLDL